MTYFTINMDKLLIIDPEIEIRINFEKISSFVSHFINGSNFAFLLNFGLIQQGKSTFSQKISGVQHEIGDLIEAKTKGIIISYCGNVQHIIDKFGLKQEILTDKNLHIFNIDTEGLSKNINESLLKIIFSFIQTCSVLIVYGMSFTDSTIFSIIDGLNHLTNANIIITLKNSYEIIDNSNRSIDYYLYKAKKSDLWKMITHNNINTEIIPCTDFREKIKIDFSEEMNKYLISRILNIINSKQWNDPSFFAKTLENIYEKQNCRFIMAALFSKNPIDSIINAIKHDFMLRINQEHGNSNDISFYDELSIQITNELKHIWKKLKIYDEKYNDVQRSLTSYIEIKKINAQLIFDQIEEEKRIFDEKKCCLEKEIDLIDFLSTQIYTISNVFLLNIVSNIVSHDISSLRMMKSYFLIKCYNLLSTTTPYIRKEMIDYIENDIKELSNIIEQNAVSAANKIDELNKEKSKQIKLKTGKIIIDIGSFIGSIICTFCGKPQISLLISSLFNIAKIPFNLTDKPCNDNFVIKIGTKTFQSTYEELELFLDQISSTFCEDYRSISDLLTKEIDTSQIQTLPINIEQRNYKDFFIKIMENK